MVMVVVSHTISNFTLPKAVRELSAQVNTQSRPLHLSTTKSVSCLGTNIKRINTWLQLCKRFQSAVSRYSRKPNFTIGLKLRIEENIVF